jgi:hypothetical protein
VQGWRKLLVAVALPCAAACAAIPQQEFGVDLPQPLPARIELTEVPFYPQEKNRCGPAALATALGSAGVSIQPQQLESEVYLPARRGSLQLEMLGASRRAGVLPYVIDGNPVALLQEVAAGHPVVVLQNLRFDLLPQWHYSVVVGYDLQQGTVVLRSGATKRQVMRIEDFDRSWAKAQRWGFVALSPDTLPATARESDYVSAVAAFERVSPTSAGRAYRTALSAWPKNLFARLALGNIAYHLGQLDEAMAQYRQAVGYHPGSADAWNNLAEVLQQEGRLEDAHGAASRAVAIGGARLGTYKSTLGDIDAGLAGGG